MPVRFVSVLLVAYGSVAALALSITAPETFVGDLPRTERLYVTLRAISVAAIFSVVGAVTTDSLF